jgi:hypothetical protein
VKAKKSRRNFEDRRAKEKGKGKSRETMRWRQAVLSRSR